MLVFVVYFTISLKDRRGVSEKLLLPTAEESFIDVEIAADLSSAFATAKKLQDSLGFQLGFEGSLFRHSGLLFLNCSSVCFYCPVLGDHYTLLCPSRPSFIGFLVICYTIEQKGCTVQF